MSDAPKLTEKEKYEKALEKEKERLLDEKKKAEEQKRERTVKIGRNDPCVCGSGKKFKKCCIEKLSNRQPASLMKKK